MVLTATAAPASAVPLHSRAYIAGQWHTVTHKVVGTARTVLWLDGKPWPSVRSSRTVRYYLTK